MYVIYLASFPLNASAVYIRHFFHFSVALLMVQYSRTVDQVKIEGLNNKRLQLQTSTNVYPLDQNWEQNTKN